MKTAIFIHSYAKANPTVARHWPFYKKAGMDLFGVGRTNTVCEWPESISTRNIGLDAYVDGDNLCRRLIDTYDWFLSDPQFNGYSDAMIIEYDSIFLKPPPVSGITAAAHLAGGRLPNLHANQFYHCPWWLNRENASLMVNQGRKLINAGEYEGGTPDFFFSRVLEENGVVVQNLHGTYSQNTVDSERCQKECRTLIQAGILWFVHGIKTPQQLAAVLP